MSPRWDRSSCSIPGHTGRPTSLIRIGLSLGHQKDRPSQTSPTTSTPIPASPLPITASSAGLNPNTRQAHKTATGAHYPSSSVDHLSNSPSSPNSLPSIYRDDRSGRCRIWTRTSRRCGRTRLLGADRLPISLVGFFCFCCTSRPCCSGLDTISSYARSPMRNGCCGDRHDLVCDKS